MRKKYIESYQVPIDTIQIKTLFKVIYVLALLQILHVFERDLMKIMIKIYHNYFFSLSLSFNYIYITFSIFYFGVIEYMKIVCCCCCCFLKHNWISSKLWLDINYETNSERKWNAKSFVVFMVLFLVSSYNYWDEKIAKTRHGRRSCNCNSLYFLPLSLIYYLVLIIPLI